MNKRTLLIVFAMLYLNINASGPKNLQYQRETFVLFKELYEGGSEIKMGIVSDSGNEYALLSIDAGVKGTTDGLCHDIKGELPNIWNLFIEKNKDRLPAIGTVSIIASDKRLADVASNFLRALK